MDGRETIINDMKGRVEQLRSDIDRLTENAQKDARYRYHRLKDELNELDKTIDKIREVADNSWLTIKDDVTVMWKNIKKEVEEEKLNERKVK